MVMLAVSIPALLLAMHMYIPASPYVTPLTSRRPVALFTSILEPDLCDISVRLFMPLWIQVKVGGRSPFALQLSSKSVSLCTALVGGGVMVVFEGGTVCVCVCVCMHIYADQIADKNCGQQ